MRNRVFVGLAVLTVTAVPVGAQTVEIGHEPVGGAVVERFPHLEAGSKERSSGQVGLADGHLFVGYAGL